ncbi:protein disulfide isomerase [Auricularia subglabra TFB-10046 SS5]|nr:protein disulfide isomerase [Auricularia subglabra TFB-10046 SS5]
MRLSRLLSTALLLRLAAATDAFITSSSAVATSTDPVDVSANADAPATTNEHAQAVLETSDVISLTTLDFNSIVDPEALILVEFFAPWCTYCKALAPHYEEAATALKERGIKLAKVDCVAEEDLCKSYDVKSYPTLKVFQKGTPSDYTGPREAKGIIAHIITLPAVAEVTAATHDEFKISGKIVVIAYGPSTPPAFAEVAEKHRDDYVFGSTTEEIAGVTPPAVVLYSTFDEPRVDFPNATYTAEDLASFLEAHAHPLIDELSAETADRFRASGLPLAYVFLDPADPQNAEHIELLRPAAQKHKGALNFVHIDADAFAAHAEALGLAGSAWPVFLIQDLQKNLKYPLSGALTAHWIEEFADAYVAGTLKPKLRSQPVPERQDESVWTVVSDSFIEVVFDDAKDVFVELYAPWCGHCKTLKPIWDQLGERYAAFGDRIIIAEMDATENDLPPEAGFTVPSFPTLKFKKAGSREFISFYGDRTLDALVEFVEKNAVNALDAAAKTAEVAAAAETPKVVERGDETVLKQHHDEL